MAKYLVRQYAPAYCTGFDLDAASGVEYDDILKAPWLQRNRGPEFDKLTIEPSKGTDELFIMANYHNGKRWVMGFALPENSTEKAPDGGLLRDNWRYKPHES